VNIPFEFRTSKYAKARIEISKLPIVVTEGSIECGTRAPDSLRMVADPTHSGCPVLFDLCFIADGVPPYWRRPRKVGCDAGYEIFCPLTAAPLWETVLRPSKDCGWM
jgi:hypothetical protein